MPVVFAAGNARRRTRPVATAFVFVLATVGCLGLPGIARPAPGAPRLDPEERAMCQQINRYRTANGLRPLKVSVKLTRAARWMSLNMATHDYLAHSDSRGRGTIARIRSFGYRAVPTGENLAGGQAGAAATFGQWKQDAPHRAGMLRTRFRVIGIGRAYRAGSTLGWYWSTTFGATNDRGVAC